MTQLSFAFDQGDQYAEQCRLYARAGNVTMANIYLHKWACEVRGERLGEFVAELRRLAEGNCLEPQAIGDPSYF